MNVERCVALHNEITRYGWVKSGRSPELFDSQCPVYFDYFTNATRIGLNEDLIKFLEQARIVEPNEFSFFYWVHDLVCWLGKDDPLTSSMDESREEDGRYLLLYSMNMFGSHRLGLVFDQKTSLSIMCNTIWECGTVLNGRMAWYPLETILEIWLEQTRKGIFVATSRDERKRIDHIGIDEYEPWLLATYSETVLDDTVDTFNRLVHAIEDRIPQTSEVLATEIMTGLVDEEDLHLVKIRDGFAYEFLRRAQRPRFRMIAPGLEVQQSSVFTKQPFWCHLVTIAYQLPPILLFRAVHPSGTDEEPYTGPSDDSNHAFSCRPFSQTKDYPAGLYLNIDEVPQDMCKMVLPFGIGANGYARKSDGSLFGENQECETAEARDVYTELYSVGHDPFGLIGSHSLLRVLKNWLAMVERGDWKVNENGVAGGMDKWKEADTGEHWKNYVIPMLEG